MPAHTTRPPLRVAANAAGTSAPTAAKMIAASRGSGGFSSEPPAQTAPNVARKLLALEIAWTGEGEYIPTFGARNLRKKMRGCSEAVQTQIGSRPRCAICSIADEAGAQQGRGFGIRVARGQGKAIAGIGYDELRVAPIDGVTGEAGEFTEVFHSVATIAAGAAGVCEPRHTKHGRRRLR